jgi:hypothetical protein
LGLVGRKAIGTTSGSADVVLGNTASSSRAGSRSAAGGDGCGDDRGLDTSRAGDSQSSGLGHSDSLAVDGDNRGGRAVGNVISGEDGSISSACGSDQGQRSGSRNAGGATRVGVGRVASIGGAGRRSDQSQRASSRNAGGATRVGVGRVASIGGACGRSDQGQRSSSRDTRGATGVRVGRVASVGGSS